MNLADAKTGGSATPARGGDARLLPLAMSLFFAFGFCTVLVDTLIPKLKAMFQLTYAEVMLTQSCYFAAYFVISIPAGWLLSKIGYLKGITMGLLIMAVGCLMFTPAARSGVYAGFLVALFILASGVTLVQVAANPLATGLGDPAKAPARLTLAQAFNSLATMVGPLFGSYLILSHGLASPDAKTAAPAVLAAYRVQEAKVVQTPFLGIALALAALAVVCWLVRRWAPPAEAQSVGGFGKLARQSRVVLGAVSLFAYVGAEVSIGSSIANYLMLSSTLGLPAPTAGSLVSVYWGLAMVGRFIGAWVLNKAPPGAVLAACAIGAAVLAAISALSFGMPAAVTLLGVGLFNAVMFPTIFSLAIEGQGDQASEASGFLCLAIVGGAVVPWLTGLAADRFGLAHAFFVPVICYLWILTYGVLAHTGRIPPRPQRAPA
jgi:FHS family L-fucose permease-like MFS transporter